MTKKMVHTEVKMTLNIPVYEDDLERAIAKSIQIAGNICNDTKFCKEYVVGRAWVTHIGD